MEDTLANAALPRTRFGDVGIRTDDEKCACNEHLAVFQMMKLLDFQEIETLLAPYFLQKGHFFILFEKKHVFLNKVIDFGETPPLGDFAFFEENFNFLV